MCVRNENGMHPSCIEAQFGGPGAEEYGLCFQCANILNDQKNRLRDLLKRFTDLDCCTGYSLGQKDYPAFWDALDEARTILQSNKIRHCNLAGYGCTKNDDCKCTCRGCVAVVNF